MIAVETAVAFATILLLVLGAWSWWNLAAVVFIVGLTALLHVYTVDGFSIDEHGQPITGRDADEFARWKMNPGR